MLTDLNNSFISPIRRVFLNALQMMVAPVTFFAIISGITNLSDASDISKIGGTLVKSSVFMLLVMSFVGLALGTLVFPHELSYLQAGIGSGADTGTLTQQTSLKSLIFDIVPDNLVDPFKGKNILQVLFLAIFFGIVINRMGDKARGATECIDFMFRFVVGTLKIIVKGIPLIVFLSMTSLLASTGLDSILVFGSLFLGLFIGVTLVWGVDSLAVFVLGKISPLSWIKKIIAFSPLMFTLSSSNARLPFVLKFCADRLGVDPRLTSFSIPVGVQLNKTGQCVYFSLVTLMMMQVYNIELTTDLMVTLYFAVALMSIAKPSIPCGGIICLSYLFMMVGIPAEAISIILCIEPLAAMFNGVCNESTNIASTFIVASSLKMLDKEKYTAP